MEVYDAIYFFIVLLLIDRGRLYFIRIIDYVALNNIDGISYKKNSGLIKKGPSFLKGSWVNKKEVKEYIVKHSESDDAKALSLLYFKGQLFDRVAMVLMLFYLPFLLYRIF